MFTVDLLVKKKEKVFSNKKVKSLQWKSALFEHLYDWAQAPHTGFH